MACFIRLGGDGFFMITCCMACWMAESCMYVVRVFFKLFFIHRSFIAIPAGAWRCDCMGSTCMVVEIFYTLEDRDASAAMEVTVIVLVFNRVVTIWIPDTD